MSHDLPGMSNISGSTKWQKSSLYPPMAVSSLDVSWRGNTPGAKKTGTCQLAGAGC